MSYPLLCAIDHKKAHIDQSGIILRVTEDYLYLIETLHSSANFGEYRPNSVDVKDLLSIVTKRVLLQGVRKLLITLYLDRHLKSELLTTLFSVLSFIVTDMV